MAGKSKRIITIEELPYFLYEYSVYLITKNSAVLLLSKFYKSDKELKEVTKCKTYKNYIIQRSISVVGAPVKFINKYERTR